MTAKLRADVEAGQKDLREELLDAREAHRSALATVEELQGVVKKLEAKIAAKDEKYRSVKEAVSLAEAKALNATNELASLAANHKTELDEARNLQKSAESAEADSLRGELLMEKKLRASEAAAHEEALAVTAQEAGAQAERLKSELGQQKKAVSSLEAEVAVLRGSGKEYQGRAEKAEAKVKDLEALAGRFEASHRGEANKVITLEREIERLTQENQRHLDSLEQTTARLAEAYADLEKEKNKVEEMSPQVAKLPDLEAQCQSLQAALDEARKEAEARVEAIKAAEAEERASAMQRLLHSQIHVVVSAPCIKLVINHSKDQVYLAPPDQVTKQVKKLLEEDVLPSYLSVMASAPESASQLAGDKMQKFCDDVAAGINDQIQAIVMEGGASAGVIQRG